MKLSKRQASTIVTVAVLLSVVFINLISSRHFVRLDLTRDQKYSLSPISRQTMKGLQDVMSISAYFSQDLPAPYASYALQVQDLFEEYRAASNGKLSFEITDPQLSESDADKAIKKKASRDLYGRVLREPTQVESDLAEAGIEPVEIRTIEDDREQSKRVYMGILLRYQGKQEVIAVVQDVANLEKDLTLAMRKLMRVKVPVLALYQDVPLASLAKLRLLLSQNVEVREIKWDEKGPLLEGADALMVVGSARNISPKAVGLIDGFLRASKGVALFIDRFEVNPNTFVTKPEEQGTWPIFDLTTRYGIVVGFDLVGDVHSAMQYPFLPEVIGLNQESLVTHDLPGLLMPFASSLQMKQVSGVKPRVLASSSKNSWIEHPPLDTDPNREWRKENVKLSGPHALMVESQRALGGQAKDARLLVAATSAMLWDQFLVGPNQTLALNVVDWLMADDSLLAMRTRSFVDLPLNADISDDTRAALKLGNIIGAPVLLVVYGLWRWRRRERRRAKP
jgi:ABC-type uncharacterized transport system involved in gliding motility auxiliary subunit